MRTLMNILFIRPEKTLIVKHISHRTLRHLHYRVAQYPLARNLLYKRYMLSSVSSANSLNVTPLNTASLLARVREARTASLIDRVANAVDPTTNAVDPMYVKALYNACDLFFNGNSTKVGLVKIEELLKNELNAVLSLISSVRTYDFPLDIAKILDENKLTNACKKGNEAYKFYVRKIVSELNNLHEIITSAKNDLSRLQTLIRTEDFGNPAIRELLTQLRLAELDGEAVKKTFSEYMVPKNFDITYVDVYKDSDGIVKPKPTKSTPKSTAQGSEAYTMPENTEVNWEEAKSKGQFQSRIPDNISSVNDLRTKITTEKLTGNRTVYTCYFKKGSDKTEWTDRYDTSAEVDYYSKDSVVRTDNNEISFFGELTLLDKLKYIVLYYTKDGERRTFPEDPNVGFPCLSNPAPTGTNPATGEDRKYTDDINEIAHLEPFYIGFLVDRDGPVNALASFMEIKSAAIGEQIKVLGYRIKALRYYLRLVNRGLEEVSKSQSNGNARIPNSAYEILTMVGSNPTRCLKTIDGKDYFVLQWNGDEGKASYHTTDNNRYMLVPADDEGIEAFINYADYPGLDYCYDRIFSSDKGVYSGDGWEAGSRLIGLGLMSQSEWDNQRNLNQQLENASIWGYEVKNGGLTLGYKYQWVYYNWGDRDVRHDINSTKQVDVRPLRILDEPDESKLPRELETNHINITGLLNQNYKGNTWNNYKDDKYGKATYPSIVSSWMQTYDTVIGNIETQLESVNKSIESLRNKINTFDTSAINFRNKAYTIYNKTVNNIE